ncbi:MAG: MFS transporter [Cyanobacteria bacterium P01_H01_bin.74]
MPIPTQLNPRNPNDEETPLPVSDAAETTAGYWPVLKNKNFLALWVGQIFSQVADRIIFVVFISLIVYHFGASDRYSSFLYIAFTIPAILLTAVAGVFVDRWPRKAVLMTTNLIRAALLALIPWIATLTGGWAIYGVAFLISTATQFFTPAEAATIPDIVPKSNLLTANSLFTTTMMVAVIFGFALGDPLINLFSLKQVHWAITLLFVLSSIAIMQLRLPKLNADKRTAQKKPGLNESFKRLLNEIAEGYDFIQQNPLVRNAMIKLALLFSTMVALCILFISFAKTYLYEDPLLASQKFAYIITFSGIGMAMGAFCLGNAFQHVRRSKLVYSGFIAVGAGLLLLTLTGLIIKSQFPLSLSELLSPIFQIEPIDFTWRMLYTYCLSMIMGVGAAFVAVPLQAVLQELIPEDKRGKVFGLQFTVLSTSSTLPVLLAGLAVEYSGVNALFCLIGFPLLIVGLFGLKYCLSKQGREPAYANW